VAVLSLLSLFSLSGTLTLLVSLKHTHTCFFCLSGSLTPAFGKCIEANQTWVPILEKAYAKLHGACVPLLSLFSTKLL
jgi:hypothetical protein